MNIVSGTQGRHGKNMKNIITNNTPEFESICVKMESSSITVKKMSQISNNVQTELTLLYITQCSWYNLMYMQDSCTPYK